MHGLPAHPQPGDVAVWTGREWATARRAVPVAAVLALIDGVQAPAAVAGRAQLYVDAADGDLKVVFGDGTIKTIVVDT